MPVGTRPGELYFVESSVNVPRSVETGGSTLAVTFIYAYTIATNIGFVSTDSLMVTYALKKWKKKKVINHEMALRYFGQFRELANKMAINKPNPAIRIMHKGQDFYWLNEDYMPRLLAN